MVLYVIEAVIYATWSLGRISASSSSVGAIIIISAQLAAAGWIVVLFDEAHRVGSGVCSSFVSLTIAINTCSDVMWKVKYILF